MKLRVDFGLNGPKREIAWWDALSSFPKYFSLDGKKWEWVLYDKDPSRNYDHILTYSEITSKDRSFNEPMEDFDIKFTNTEKCECGALYSSFPWDHMRFCKLWRRW